MVVLALAVSPRLVVIGRRVRSRLSLRPEAEDVSTLAEMTALALTAGLSLQHALEAAAGHVSPEVGREVRRVVREARRHGIGPALLRASGGASGLYRIAARASVTGAPVLPAVSGYLGEVRGRERLRRVERLRKLPVKMLFPLALLILPGFLVLTVAPTLLGALERLRL